MVSGTGLGPVSTQSKCAILPLDDPEIKLVEGDRVALPESEDK